MLVVQRSSRRKSVMRASPNVPPSSRIWRNTLAPVWCVRSIVGAIWAVVCLATGAGASAVVFTVAFDALPDPMAFAVVSFAAACSAGAPHRRGSAQEPVRSTKYTSRIISVQKYPDLCLSPPNQSHSGHRSMLLSWMGQKNAGRPYFMARRMSAMDWAPASDAFRDCAASIVRVWAEASHRSATGSNDSAFGE